MVIYYLNLSMFNYQYSIFFFVKITNENETIRHVILKRDTDAKRAIKMLGC